MACELPLTPWHGGFFDRLVQNCQPLALKISTKPSCPYEEMLTLLRTRTNNKYSTIIKLYPTVIYLKF